MQIGGWVNQCIAIGLLLAAAIWTIASILYYWKKRKGVDLEEAKLSIEVHECSLESIKPLYLTLNVQVTIKTTILPMNVASLKLYMGDWEIGEPTSIVLPIVVINSPESFVLKYDIRTSLIGKENPGYISALARGERVSSNIIPIPYDSPLLPQIILGKIRPLPNRNDLLRTLAEAKIATTELARHFESLKHWQNMHPNLVNVEGMVAVEEAQKRQKIAFEALEKEILVAGKNWEAELKPLYMFMQSSALLNASPEESKGTILTYKNKLADLIEQVRNKIDEI